MPPKGWGGFYDYVSSYDANGDYHPDGVFSVNGQWDREPLGVFAYDFQSKKVIWFFESSNFISAVKRCDVDFDQIPEFLIIGTAPVNDTERGQLIDDRCRISIIDDRAHITKKERWSWEFQKGSRDCAVAFSASNGDSLCILFIAVNHIYREKPSTGKTRQSEIYKIDLAKRKILESTIIDGVVGTIISFKMGNEDGAWIAVNTSDGRILIYDYSLKLQVSRAFGEHANLNVVDYLNSDGFPEFLVSSMSGKSYMLNWKLDDLYIIEEDSGAISAQEMWVAHSAPGKAEKILINRENIEGQSHTRYKIPYIPNVGFIGYYGSLLSRHKNEVSWAAASVIFTLACISLELRHRRKKRVYDALFSDEKTGLVHVKNGRILHLSSRAGALLNIDPQKLKMKEVDELQQVEGLEGIYSSLRDSLNSGVLDGIVTRVNRGAVQREIELEISVIKRRNEKPHEYLVRVLLPDIGRKEWLTLARGIAHDVSGPSGLANVLLSGLSAELTGTQELKVNEVIQKIDRANANIRQSLARIEKFVGIVEDSKLKLENVDIARFLKNHVLIQRVSTPKEISLDFEPSLVDCMTLLDRDKIERALGNLLNNAIDAVSIKKSGAIRVSLIEVNTPIMHDGAEQMARCSCIAISDTGCGIPKRDLQKLFDLDFSTKKGRPDGKGFGIGLFEVKRIIYQHGGKIEVESYEGEGTTFKLYIPVTK
jgi:signal transduction histidine kinase